VVLLNPSHAEDLPEKIAKYEILGIAGRGAMGIVYIGYDPFIDRKVAIKVCSFQDDTSDSLVPPRQSRKMFFNEAQSAGSLDHKNILKVYEAGEAEGEPYIVMEYLDGAETLKPYCSVDRLLPMERVVEIIQQCAEALDYAHRQGVTHRDIKPANIMLTKLGEVKIVDFGVAHRGRSDQTQFTGILGSPLYMSPEQAREDLVNNQTDIYSLGVVLYELLAGKPPFDPQGLSALIYKILHEEPSPLHKIRPQLPEDLEAVVRRAMEKTLDKRYLTGKEMATDLGAVLRQIRRPEENLTKERKFEIVRKLRFFEGFTDPEISEVLRSSSWENYPAGTRIIEEGTKDNCFFILISGEVGIFKGSKKVATVGPGECIGEMGYLLPMERTASVVASHKISVLRIGSALTTWASLPCQMHFSKAFQRTLVERLASTSERLMEYMNQ
jgi:serine/threonine protein kinase